MIRHLIVIALLVIGLSQSAAAQDWEQWRGPTRDGIVSAAGAPTSWPNSLRRAWRVEIGEGYSSPVVSRGTVFVHSRRDPEEVVMALNLATGKVLWENKYTADFKKNQYAVKMAKGPNATPLVIGKRLFTLGVTGILHAWDTASGKLIWTKDFSKTVDTSKMFCGTAASPLAVGGRLVVQTGSDIHGGQIAALDPTTGKVVWEWKGPGPGYASPVVIDVAGKKQLTTFTNGSVVGLDAMTGAELWSMPFPDEWHENIVTPVWTGTHLIVSGVRQGTHAFALSQTAGKWQATEVWKNADVAMYMSSPVYGDGMIYGLSEKKKGQFVALDVRTGVIRWATEGREGDHASVLLTPRNLIYLTNGADLIIADRASASSTGASSSNAASASNAASGANGASGSNAASGANAASSANAASGSNAASVFKIVKRYDVADAETWAVPILLGSDLLIRDSTGLMRLTPGP